MTRRMLAVAALLIVPPVALAAPPPGTNSAVARLVAQLGSDEFAEREAATKELDALGAAALAEIRSACQSADPEVAHRARELSHRVGRRLDNEKVLAPTLVELSSDDVPLEAVLADLSKQSGYAVVLGGLKLDELAAKKVTLKTGRVAFWDAVRLVGDAAGLQIASVGGFTAPGSLPYYPPPARTMPGARPQALGADRPLPMPGPIAGQLEAAKRATPRPAASPNSTIVLEARDPGRKRAQAVYGAVCVEAFPVPLPGATPAAATSLLQLWPEPKLVWKETRGVSVTRAADEQAQTLRTLPAPPPPAGVQMIRGNNVRVIQNANGVVVLNGEVLDLSQPAAGGYAANVRQSVVKFKPGAKPSAVLKEFTGSVFGVIRSPTEALASVELAPGKAVTAAGTGAVSLSATLLPKDGFNTSRLEVELSYDQLAVQPANATDALAGMKNPTAVGNHTVQGVRVTDADGNPLSVSLSSVVQARFNATGRLTYRLFMTVGPIEGAPGEPAAVAFWGTSSKTVEVPFDLRDAPLVTGKK